MTLLNDLPVSRWTGTTDQVADLARRVRRAWSAETSIDPGGWSPANPAYGQCAVTSLVVQDMLGGELIRSRVGGVSHYFNQLPDGRIVDLTREQFSSEAELTDVAGSSRGYVLAFEPTRLRYKLLLERLTGDAS